MTAVTIVVPDGYADAEEFLKDCGFERPEGPPSAFAYERERIAKVICCPSGCMLLEADGGCVAFNQDFRFLSTADKIIAVLPAKTTREAVIEECANRIDEMLAADEALAHPDSVMHGYTTGGYRNALREAAKALREMIA